MTDSHIRIENVTFSRGTRRIFDGVSLEIPRGKVVAIMGPSGSGKTTLLRLIGGQLKPATGKVWVEDKCVSSLDREELFGLRRNMGMLFQSGALFTDLSAFDNVAFPLRIHTDMPEEMIRDLVLIKLQAVGLRGASQLFPSELSGGMNRRVALARAIALDPAMIMYDLQETASIADIIYVIADGKLIGSGSPEELFNEESPRIQQFIKGLPDGPVPFHYPARDFKEELLEGSA